MEKRSRIAELEELGWSHEKIEELWLEMLNLKKVNNVELDDYEERVKLTLFQLNFQFNWKGTQYIIASLLYMKENGFEKKKFLSHICGHLACIFHKTTGNVDRILRYAIERAYLMKDSNNQEIWDWTCPKKGGRPSITEFIIGIYLYLDSELDSF